MYTSMLVQPEYTTRNSYDNVMTGTFAVIVFFSKSPKQRKTIQDHEINVPTAQNIVMGDPKHLPERQ